MDFREVTEEKDKTEVVEVENKEEAKEPDDYEPVCFMCRRQESKVDKLIHLPGDMYICTDCMQKSMDAWNQGDLDLSQLGNLNIPGLTYIDLTDPMNQVSNRQKLTRKPKPETKKAENGEQEAAFDLKKICIKPLGTLYMGSNNEIIYYVLKDLVIQNKK